MARAFKTGITADGDVITSAKLQSTASAGDEGGEIFLNKAVTNTTITGGVTIDVYQNKLRFFEQGGSARGFYLDITAGGTGVSTNLAGTATDTNYYPSAIVFNAGTTAGPTLDLTMSGSGAPDLTAVAIPSASGTASGVVTTGTQTFAGTKTFSNTITADISGNAGTVTNGVYTTNIGSTVQAYDADLTAIAGLTSAADRLPYYTGAGTASLATFTSFGRSLVDDADAAAGRSTLGLVIGTNVQAYDAELAALAGLTSAADTVPYFTGSGTAALATFTAFGRSLAEDADAAAGRTTLGATTVGGNLFTLTNPSVLSWPRINADNTVTARSATNTRSDLGLVIGTDVQAYDADLAAIAALSGTSGVLKKTAANTWALDTTIPATLFHTPVANYTVATTTTANATISGQAFGVTPTLTASTTYLFESILFVQTTIGSGTGTNFTLSWTTGGAGTTGNVQMMTNAGLASLTTSSTTTTSLQVTNFSSVTPVSSPAGTQVTKVVMKGVVRTGASSPTIYPVLGITNSSTPGVPTSITTLVGSYMRFDTLTSSASNVSIGTWV